MKRRVLLSSQARFDLLALRRWYSQPGSGAAAKAKAQTIVRAIAQLGNDPCAYRHDTDFQARVMLVGGHRVLFQLLPDTGSRDTAGDVSVLRIFGPGQDVG